MRQSSIENPEKLATKSTHNEDKQTNNNKNPQHTTQYVLDTNIRKQTQLTLTRHEPSYAIIRSLSYTFYVSRLNIPLVFRIKTSK